MNEKLCPSCHRSLPADAPAGLCPSCVLRAALEASPPPDGPLLEELRAAFPQWQVLECIGRGGMGIVYKIRQPHLDRIVALKILAPELADDPGFAERFTREGRTLAKLTHPNIVSVYDFGESGGFYYLLMECVEGVNLRQAMQTARFTPEQALSLIPDLCSALQFAHDQGVLHRDIKPENILLDAKGRVKIADFGIARLLDDSPGDVTLTATGSVIGSTAYMAPEQIEHPHDVDHRADIYSLGVVFYEMLTGGLPLGRFPAPSEKTSSDPRLDEVVFRALEKERERRYQSAGEVREGVDYATKVVPKSKHRSLEISADGLPSLPLYVIRPLLLQVAGIIGIGSVSLRENGLIASHVWRKLTLQAPNESLNPDFWWMQMLLILSVFAVALGFCWSFWNLILMKRNQLPVKGRNVLLGFSFWPAIAGLFALSTWSWTSKLLPYAERVAMGSITSESPSWLQVCFALSAFLLPLLVGKRLWHRISIPSSAGNGNRRKKILAAFASVLLLFASIGMAKIMVEQLPLYARYKCVTLHFTLANPLTNWTEGDRALLMDTINESLGRQADQYRVQYDPMFLNASFRSEKLPLRQDVLIGVLAQNRSIGHEHMIAIDKRLQARLPKVFQLLSKDVGNFDFTVRDAQQRVHGLGFYLLCSTALAGCLVVFVGWKETGLIVAMGSGLVVIALSTPGWIKPAALPPSLVGRMPLPGLLVLAYDFSTPKSAMESMIKAAKANDLATLQRGFAKEYFELPTEQNGMNLAQRPMSEVAKSLSTLTYFSAEYLDAQNADSWMGVTQTPEDLFVKAQLNGKDERGEMGVFVMMKREGVEWKLTGRTLAFHIPAE